MVGKILFLQSEIHNYHISLYKEIVTEYNYEIIVIYKDTDNETPFIPQEINGVTYIGKSRFKTFAQFKNFVISYDYKMIRTSGWSDINYLRISNFLRSKGKTVVAVSDTQWKNQFKQTFCTYTFGWFIRNSFSKIMVAGPYQFEYARKLGFSKKNILFNNLSADSEVFINYNNNNTIKKSILYVGRLEKIKGIHLLFDAWNSIIDKKGWKLEVVGNGSLLDYKNSSEIDFKGYLSNVEINKLMTSASFFVLPSLKEPWGVVIHEAALSGLPILCSNAVGSIPYFLVNGYNGFTFETGNVDDLRNKLLKILSLKEDEIRKFKNNSLSLGHRITTKISAASLMSAIVKNS